MVSKEDEPREEGHRGVFVGSGQLRINERFRVQSKGDRRKGPGSPGV